MPIFAELAAALFELASAALHSHGAGQGSLPE